MKISRLIFGNEMECMPDIAFRAMSLFFRSIDIFFPVEKRVSRSGIKNGFIVVDYGCGPGRYIPSVSKLIGDTGKIYAVDIHPLAIKYVKKKVQKFGLRNVEPVLAEGYHSNIKSRTADMIYVLDTFHMIEEPDRFLKELHRVIKSSGFLIIDNGHQSRAETIRKIDHARVWQIVEASKDHLKCMPL
jgi:ubiquinone/menaquinone biosynthesis C-methylase UbiE